GKTSVSLFLREVGAQAVIEALCKSNNLWYRREADSGIVRIMTVAEFQRDLLSFREEKTEVFTLFYPNAVDVGAAIRDLFGDRVRLSIGRDRMFDDLRELENRFDRFDIVDQRSQGLGIFQGGNNTNFLGGAGANRFNNGLDSGRSSRF